MNKLFFLLALSPLMTANAFAASVWDSLAVDAARDTVYEYVLGESLLSERRPSPVRSSQYQIAVFDRKVELASPLLTVESVLRILPSLDLRERGGRGAQADISIRGGSADQTMVMLNGINFTDARTGHQSHSLPVDMESVSSISLIRDVPGTGALSGAVNLTARGICPNYLRSELSAGANGYYFGSLSGARTSDNTSLFGSMSVRNSDGYRYNTDYRNYNAYLRAEHNSPAIGYFDFQVGLQSRRFGSNGFYAAYNPDQYEYTRTALASLRYTRRSGPLAVAANASYRKNYDQYEWVKGTPSNYHETDNAGAELRGSLDWVAGTSVLGADLSYNHIYSSNLGEKLSEPVGADGRYKCEGSRLVSNIYTSHSKSWSRVSVSAMGGVSLTSYGQSALWSASARYAPVQGLEVVIQCGQSSRLPTFTDLYYTSKAQVNNPDLVPEKAMNYNVDVDWSRASFSAGIHSYLRDTRDRIAWVWRDHLTIDDRQYTSVWHSEQISRMYNYGVEIEGAYSWKTGVLGRVKMSYAYASADVVSPLPVSTTMDFLKHKAVLCADFRLFTGCTLSAICSLYDRFGSYNDYLRDADGNLLKDSDGAMLTVPVDYAPYCLLDLRLSYQRGRSRFYVDATNVTSTPYCDFGGIEMPLCWVNAGVVVMIAK